MGFEEAAPAAGVAAEEAAQEEEAAAAQVEEAAAQEEEEAAQVEEEAAAQEEATDTMDAVVRAKTRIDGFGKVVYVSFQRLHQREQRTERGHHTHRFRWRYCSTQCTDIAQHTGASLRWVWRRRRQCGRWLKKKTRGRRPPTHNKKRCQL
jgi:hypothetical protein